MGHLISLWVCASLVTHDMRQIFMGVYNGHVYIIFQEKPIEIFALFKQGCLFVCWIVLFIMNTDSWWDKWLTAIYPGIMNWLVTVHGGQW